MTTSERVDVLVIGSGAGGATTAYELASAGSRVTVLEEGSAIDVSTFPQHAPDMMQASYRHRGMNPIMGRAPVAVVEGSLVGGSTEINSGFWARAPREILLGWASRYDLQQCSAADLAPHYEWAEEVMGVATLEGEWPRATRVFADGIEAMGWAYQEVPRVRPLDADDQLQQATAGMSQTVLPMAVEAGATIVSGCQVQQLLRRGSRIEGALAHRQRGDRIEVVRYLADHVVVACGPTETPALLRRSGVRERVGNTLRIHPMLKLAARFDEPIHAGRGPLPLLQVKQFAPDITLGGAFFSDGHLAMMLSDNWETARAQMEQADHFATYYVAVKGNGKGLVRPSLLDPGRVALRYELSSDDLKSLSVGMGRLAMLLLAAGAEELYPSVQAMGPIRTEAEATRWLDERLPKSRMSLTTVHLFASCPAGERRDRCAVDSFGRVFGFDNLYVNDASILPDSPGVNPQGTVMAMARRNALRLAESLE